MTSRALFLDRDGVINVDKGYVHDVADFEWMPGIFELATAARDRGLLLIVVTNQSGIARGLYTEETFQTLTAWMRKQFAEHDVPLTQIYHCPYLTGDDGKDHPLRKPNPGMLLAAQTDHNIDMSNSAMLGDKWTDMDAALAAGVGHAGIIGDPAPEPAGAYASVARLKDLTQARNWVTKTFSD